MIVSAVGRRANRSSNAHSGSGITACAPALPLALRRVCVTSPTSLAKPPTGSASFARNLRGMNSGKYQLFADGSRTEAVFDRHAQIPQLVRELQQRRYVVAAHRYQKGVELRRRLVGRAALLQEFPEDDVPHAEAQGGKIDAAERLQQPVVAAAAAHRPQ